MKVTTTSILMASPANSSSKRTVGPACRRSRMRAIFSSTVNGSRCTVCTVGACSLSSTSDRAVSSSYMLKRSCGGGRSCSSRNGQRAWRTCQRLALLLLAAQRDGGLLEALVLEETPHQFGARVLLVERLGRLHRQQQARLDAHQRGRHDQEVAGGVEVERLDHGEVASGTAR